MSVQKGLRAVHEAPRKRPAPPRSAGAGTGSGHRERAPGLLRAANAEVGRDAEEGTA